MTRRPAGHSPSRADRVGERRRRAGGMEGPGEALLQAPHQPGGEVLHIDHGDDGARGIWHHHARSCGVGEAPGVVASAAGVIPSTADQPGAHHRPGARGLLDDLFARHLGRAVVLRAGQAVSVEWRHQFGVLGAAGLVMERVDADRGDVEPVVGGDGGGRLADAARGGGQFDDGVPPGALHLTVGVRQVAICSDQLGAARSRVRAPGQAGDAVPRVKCGRDDVAAELAGAAEDEQVHGHSLRHRPGAGQDFSGGRRRHRGDRLTGTIDFR